MYFFVFVLPIGMPAKPHLGGDSFTTHSSTSTTQSTSALDTQGMHTNKQLSNKASTIPSSMDKIIPPGGGGVTMTTSGSSGSVNAAGTAGSSGVMRPTRLTQPEKLLQLAATTQLGRLADKYSPHGQSSVKEKKSKNYEVIS